MSQAQTRMMFQAGALPWEQFEARSVAVQLSEAGPRPSEHPLLAGPQHAEARAEIERIFGAVTAVHAETELHAALQIAPTEARWIFVVDGTVRQVLRTGVSSSWPEGRDKRVVQLFGARAIFALAGGEAGPAPKAENDETVTLYYANPSLGTEERQRLRLRVRSCSASDIAALCAKYPRVRQWWPLASGTRGMEEEWKAALQAAPLLAGIPEYLATSMVRTAAWCAPPLKGAMIDANQQVFAVPFTLKGHVELVAPRPNLPAHTVGLAPTGSFALASCIPPEPHAAAGSPVELRPSIDSSFLLWDREMLWRLLAPAPTIRRRLELYADPVLAYHENREGKVCVVAADEGSIESATFAAGTALALAANRTTNSRIWLVDLSSGLAVQRALGLDANAAPWTPPADAPEGPDYFEGSGVQLMVLTNIMQLLECVEALLALADTEYVVVHVPCQANVNPELVNQLQSAWVGAAPCTTPPAGDRAEAPDAQDLLDSALGAAEAGLPLAQVALSALRRLKHDVVWLNADPMGWWTLTPEPPEYVIRVDVLTEDMVLKMRAHANDFTAGSSPEHVVDDDRPGVIPQQVARLAYVPDEFKRAAAGALPDLVSATSDGLGSLGPQTALGRACARIARMVRRRSVGLALGGGGVWGAAHIGVIEELEAHGIPIDYVAGTSFGMVVGCVYCGGGTKALRWLAKDSCLPPLGRISGGVRRRLPTAAQVLLDMRASTKTPLGAAMVAAEKGDSAALGNTILSYALPTRSAGHAPSLQELPLPFVPVSSNLTRHKPYSPYWIELGRASVSSGSLPPAFPAVRMRGDLMVDGGALANVPAEAVRAMGADFVIAVNVVGAPFADRTANKATDQAKIRLKPKDLAQRGQEAWIVAWLMLWKAGSDQAQLQADFIVDLRITGVGVPEVWYTQAVADQARQVVAAAGLANQIAAQRNAPSPAPGCVPTVSGTVNIER